MPELVIKYKSKKTMEALKDFAKYFEFSIVSPKKEKGNFKIKGVTIIPDDKSVDLSGPQAIFSNKNPDAKKIRKEAWRKRM